MYKKLLLIGFFVSLLMISACSKSPNYGIGDCVKSTEGSNVRIYAKSTDYGRWCIKYSGGATTCNFGKLLDGSYPPIVPDKWCQDDGV